MTGVFLRGEERGKERGFKENCGSQSATPISRAFPVRCLPRKHGGTEIFFDLIVVATDKEGIHVREGGCPQPPKIRRVRTRALPRAIPALTLSSTINSAATLCRTTDFIGSSKFFVEQESQVLIVHIPLFIPFKESRQTDLLTPNGARAEENRVSGEHIRVPNTNRDG